MKNRKKCCGDKMGNQIFIMGFHDMVLTTIQSVFGYSTALKEAMVNGASFAENSDAFITRVWLLPEVLGWIAPIVATGAWMWVLM